MRPKILRAFDAEAFLNSPGVARRVAAYAPAAAIFAQGDAANTVLYIQQGRVKLSVVSDTGKEAVVGVLGPGDKVHHALLSVVLHDTRVPIAERP
jgi:CRP-like cAMP-binding protein